jgi:polysaccharide export outer membrane protein
MTFPLLILNYKITVMGEVKQPGTFNIPNEKVTLIQAIASAGDFSNYGNRKEIHIIREINGERKEIIVNLNDKSVFESEVYFLKQNDIIYVPALKSKTLMSNNQLVLPFVSFTSLLLTAINLILK